MRRSLEGFVKKVSQASQHYQERHRPTGFGFALADSTSLPIYLRLLHAAIADALELGCQRVSFGRTALKPKAWLGAKPDPFRVWVRHRQPVLNLLIGNLLRSVSHEEPPENDRSSNSRDHRYRVYL